MKKILFILFVAQFILAPYIIKGYGANLVEDNYEYSGVDQGRETVEKDILGNIIIRDDNKSMPIHQVFKHGSSKRNPLEPLLFHPAHRRAVFTNLF